MKKVVKSGLLHSPPPQILEIPIPPIYWDLRVNTFCEKQEYVIKPTLKSSGNVYRNY